jgi:hypothetical protein
MKALPESGKTLPCELSSGGFATQDPTEVSISMSPNGI